MDITVLPSYNTSDEDESMEDEAEAIAAIKDLKTWSLNYKNNTSEGQRYYYRFNKVKKNGPQCAAEFQLFFPNDSTVVKSFKTQSDHSHDECGSKAISLEIKADIENLLNLNLKPKAILQKINLEHNSTIKMGQLRNCLAFIRKKQCGGRVTISVGELEQWCIESSAIPEDEDEPFVVSHKFSYADEDEEADNFSEKQEYKFGFFVSSKRLLRIASRSAIICADGAYKLNCHDIVGIALRLKYVKATAASKNVPLGQKRKPGRPAKAKKALLIQ